MRHPATLRRMSLVSPVLVGRHAELSTLLDGVDEARKRHGSTIFVTGEPGIGKSRLAAEVLATAGRSGVRVLKGRAAAGGSAVPFRPLTEAIFSALRSEGAPDSADFGPYWPSLSRLGQLPSPDNDVVEDSLVVRAEAVLRLLAVLGEDRGCLLVLEDLHDADADTLAVVDYLIDHLAALPVLLVVTVRTDPSAALELAVAATARRSAKTLRLERLDRGAVAELAAHCLGTGLDAVPPVTLRQLHRTADGTPFVVEELLGAMLDTGSLARRGAAWHADPAVATPVPGTVTGAIRQRIARLGTTPQSLLEAAAVLGQRFPVRVAANVVGLSSADAFRVLRTAVDAELVVADDDAGWHAFRHALIVEAVLGQLLPGERATLSRKAAETVENASPDLRDDWHQLAAELWASGGDYERATALFTRAGRLAAERGALLSAVTLLERGLSLYDGGHDLSPATEAELLEALTHVLALRGDHDRVSTLGTRLDDALVVADADPSRRIAARLARVRAAIATGRWDDGNAEVKAARMLAGDDAPPELTAPIDAVAARLVLFSPRPDRLDTATELAERAVAAAESVPLPAVACEALETLARCRRYHDLTDGEEILEQALGLATAHGLTHARIRTLVELGIIEKLRHGRAGKLLEARRAAENAGAIMSVVWIELHLVTVYIHIGAYADATTSVDRASALARQLQIRELELLSIGARAGIASAQGRCEEMEAALAEMGDSVLGYGAEVWDRARATCSLLQEDRERALDHFRNAAAADDAVPNIRASGFRSWYLLLRLIGGECGWDEYREVAESPLAQVSLHRPFLAWSRAVLLGRDGKHDEAMAAVAEALADSARQPHARYLGGRLVAEAALADGWGEPVEWLRASEEYFHAQDVPRVAAACRALMRKAGAQVVQRRHGHDVIPTELRQLGVTVREYEVLRLVADRLGDREIADRLFLSPRTVEKHVASLRSRTSTADRAALVAYARRHA